MRITIDLRTAVTLVAGLVAGAVGGAVMVFINLPDRVAAPSMMPGLEALGSGSGGRASGFVTQSQLNALRRQLLEMRSHSGNDPELEARLRQVEQQLQAAEKRDMVDLPSMASSEDARLAFKDRVAEHEADAVDGEWATTTNQVLNHSLEQFAREGGYQTLAVDCRTTSCEAVLRWPSQAAAEEGRRSTVRTPLATNCARELMLNEASEPDGTHQGTLLLDCTNWRSNGSEPLKLAFGPEPTRGDLGTTEAARKP